MGFNKNWDLNTIGAQLCAMRTEMNSPYNDGWTQFAIKQDFYRIKWMIDATLAQSSAYFEEEQWLQEQEQEKIIKILKTLNT